MQLRLLHRIRFGDVVSASGEKAQPQVVGAEKRSPSGAFPLCCGVMDTWAFVFFKPLFPDNK